MRNYQHAQFEAGFKRGYSLLLQASKAYIRENGSMHPGEWHWGSSAFMSDFDKYVKARKVKAAECYAHLAIMKTYNGKISPTVLSAAGGACWRLISGEIAWMVDWPSAPTVVWYDINGSKSPNRLGFDVFGFAYDDILGIVPYGAPGSGAWPVADCLEKSSAGDKNGAICALQAMKDSNYFKKLPK